MGTKRMEMDAIQSVKSNLVGNAPSMHVTQLIALIARHSVSMFVEMAYGLRLRHATTEIS